MNGRGPRVWSTVLAAAALVAGLGAMLALAGRDQPGAGFPVAVVDVFRLIDSLNEAQDLKKQIDARFKKQQEEFDKKGARLKAMAEDIKNLPPDDPTRRDKISEFRKAQEGAKVEAEIVETVFNLEGGDALAMLYGKIAATVDRVAQRDGYKLVLMDDRSRRVPEEGADPQMRAAMERKRILFAAPEVDITQRVADLMNNDFAAKRK